MVGTGVAGAASFLTPAWTSYHADGSERGFDPDSAQPVPPRKAWTSGALDGGIYAEPLVLGNRVFVATENNSVYAFNASTGAVLWYKHVGKPVPASALPCGDIDPVGIIGTPVLDPNTNAIYAVADVYDASDSSDPIRHELVAYSLSTGALLPHFPVRVDVSNGSNPQFVPANQLQRAALELDGTRIVIGFGGNDGDCNHYHGWLVGMNDGGTGTPLHYQAGPSSDSGDAIWGGGGGPVIYDGGSIYATTGNGFSDTTFDHGNTIIKLNSSLQEIDHYAPSTWAQDNDDDLDLGSANAVVLPNGLLFQTGKRGTGYLVRRATGEMGGTGVAGAPDPSAFNAPVCSPGSWGGPAFHSGVIYVPCGDPGGGGGGVVALSLNATAPSFTRVWQGPSDASSPPIVAGGLVWLVSVSDAILYGLNPSNGHVSFQTALSGPEHFTTPSAGGGRLFVGDGHIVRAFQIAQLPKPVVKITSPATGATEHSTPITVEGTVTDTVDIAGVTVNGIKATLTGGSWSASVPLKSGSNTLTATATDGATATGTASVTVTYSP